MAPNVAHNYSLARPDVVDYISGKARVFVPERPELTVPEPDLALYQGFPHHLPIRDLRWEDLTPFVVAEVLVDSDPEKDLVRNVELYFQVRPGRFRTTWGPAHRGYGGSGAVVVGAARHPFFTPALSPQ